MKRKWHFFASIVAVIKNLLKYRNDNLLLFGFSPKRGKMFLQRNMFVSKNSKKRAINYETVFPVKSERICFDCNRTTIYTKR